MKIEYIKTLSKSFSAYFFGPIISSFIGFLLMPIMTRFLTAEDYGIIATITIIITFINMCFLDVGTLIVRDYQVDKSKVKYILSAYIIQAILIFILFLILSVFFDKHIANFFSLPHGYISFIVILSLLNSFRLIFMYVLQAQNLAFKYALFTIIYTILNISFSLFLVCYLNLNWYGRFIGMLSSSFLLDSFALYYLIKKSMITIQVKYKDFKSLNSFAVPLIPHAIGAFIIISIDKFYLNRLVSVSETGVYSVAINFMAIMLIVVTAASKAMLPFAMKKLKDLQEKGKFKLIKFIYTYDIILICLAIFMTFFISIVLKFYVSQSFWTAQKYLIYLFLGVAFIGMKRTRVWFIFFTKKTNKMSFKTDFFAALINIVLCPVLIKINGPIGAAQSTMIAYLITFLSTWKIARDVFKMPWFKFKEIIHVSYRT